MDLSEAIDDGVLGWQWHQLDHMQTICTLLQTDNHTNTSSPHQVEETILLISGGHFSYTARIVDFL